MTTLGRGNIERDMRRLLPLLTLPWANVGETGDLSLTPAGNLVLAPMGSKVLPPEDAAVSLGAEDHPFNALHATDLFVNTLISGGSQVAMDGRLVVAESTTLAANVGTGDASIQVQAAILAVNDVVCLNAHGNEEWLLVTSGPTGGGPYTYGVTRNLDGSGANNWLAGDVVLNTGQAGDGFIELFQTVSLRGTDYGPAVMVWGRNSTTWNDIGARVRLGNLKGQRGYSSSTWGMWAGRYASGHTWLGIDDVNGIRIMNYATQIGRWYANGDILIGRDDAATGGNVLIANGGSLDLRKYTTSFLHLDAAGWLTVGEVWQNRSHVFIDSSRVSLRVYTDTWLDLTSSGTLTVGKVGAGLKNVYITANGLYLRDNTTTRLEISDTTSAKVVIGAAGQFQSKFYSDLIELTNASGQSYLEMGAMYLRVGRYASGYSNVYVDETGIYLRDYATNRIALSTAGAITIGETGAGKSYVTISSGTIGFVYAGSGRLSLDSSGDLWLYGRLGISTNGFIASGATAILTGDGYWLDYNAGTPRFRVGTVSGGALNKGLLWDGSEFTVKNGNGLVIDDDGLVLPVGASGTALLQWKDGANTRGQIWSLTGSTPTCGYLGLNVLYDSHMLRLGLQAESDGEVWAELYPAITSTMKGLIIGGAGTTQPTSMLDVVGDVEIGNDKAFYLGDPTTNGTWRWIRDGNDFKAQRRESGSWVTKQTIAA